MTVVKNAATLGDAVEAPRVESALDAAAFAKVTRRIVPFIVLCYFFSYLDQIGRAHV